VRNVALTAGMVVTVLCLISSDAMAQGGGPKPGADATERSFPGVVGSVNPVVLSVKGQFDPPGPSANKSAGGSKSKSNSRSVHFFLKGAKIARGWRSCEPDDIQKGESVTVTFTQSGQGKSKYIATRVDIVDESSAERQSILGKPGKVLFEDDFSRAQMPPKWRLGKGYWEIHEGIGTAAENPDDHHGAYAYAEPRFPYKDIVAEFSFKFDGSTNCHFMMEDSNYKGSHAGHIIRATITPTSAQLADSKFGSMKNEIFEKMKDPQTTADEKKEIQASIKNRVAAFKVALDVDKWHQARVEVVGDEMLLSIDNRPVGYR